MLGFICTNTQVQMNPSALAELHRSCKTEKQILLKLQNRKQILLKLQNRKRILLMSDDYLIFI